LATFAMALALASKARNKKAVPVVRPAGRKPGRTPLGIPARAEVGAFLSSPVLKARSIAPIQTKLEIGRPDDRFEREADRVAEEVLRIPPARGRLATPPPGAPGMAPAIQRLCSACEEQGHSPSIQRLCHECEEDLHRQAGENEEEELLQTEAASAEGTMPTPAIAWRIRTAMPGGGQPLPESVRTYFEPRFGHDFTDVRIHEGAAASRSARMINAQAYTVGQDIVFGEGQYAPRTSAGRRLLAHELTHVVQQRQGGPAVQRKIKFTDPTPARENPIKRVLSEPTLGYTLPTVNGKPLPDLQTAGPLLFDALQPKESSYDAATKQCRFAEFNVDVSAKVTVITQPTKNQWTMSLPGADVKGIAACHSQASVLVTMTGKPDGATIVNLVDKYEQEHVDDLKRLYAKHLEAHFNWLMGLREQGDDGAKCQAKLMATLGNKDALAVQAFMKEWLEAVAARDAKGGAHVEERREGEREVRQRHHRDVEVGTPR
jgi:hypothetical protein